MKKRLWNSKENSFNKTVLIEKIPFFLLAILFGIIALNAQQDTGAIGMTITKQFSSFDRLFIATYGFCTYLWKLIVPLNLTALYVYPAKVEGMLPMIFYLSAIPVLAFFGYLTFRFKQHRLLVFGFGFFLATILMVLQLIPVGRAILAERYSYLPYIGLFFLLGHGFIRLLEKRPQLKTIATGILAIWILGLSLIHI